MAETGLTALQREAKKTGHSVERLVRELFYGEVPEAIRLEVFGGLDSRYNPPKKIDEGYCPTTGKQVELMPYDSTMGGFPQYRCDSCNCFHSDKSVAMAKVVDAYLANKEDS